MHHFECGVWSYGSPENARIKEEYFRTLERSSRISEKKSRLSFIEWIFRNLIRIFAPLL